MSYAEISKIIAAMFIMIGNYYIINRSLPGVSSITLIDDIILITFITICINASVMAVVLNYVKKE